MPIELSEANRQTLLLVVAILSMVCFFSSFLLFLSAAYIKVTIDARTRLIQTYNSDVLPGIFVFVGIINLVQNISCIFVCLKLRETEKREQTMKLAKPVLIGGIVLVIFEVSTAIASFVHIGILDDEFREGLNRGMFDYGKGDELKREMDSVQSSYGCCGDKRYTDWFEHKWLEGSYADDAEGGNADKYLETDSKPADDNAPFSCCDVKSPRPCIHHHIHDNEKHFNYDYKVDSTLYKHGCREVLMGIYSSVLMVVGIIALIIASVKSCVLLLFRLLQTNLSKAQEMDDWEATAPAYILYYKKPDEDDEKDEGLGHEGEVAETEEEEEDTEGATTEDQAVDSENDTAVHFAVDKPSVIDFSFDQPPDTALEGRLDNKSSIISRPSASSLKRPSFFYGRGDDLDPDNDDNFRRGTKDELSSILWLTPDGEYLNGSQPQEDRLSARLSQGDTRSTMSTRGSLKPSEQRDTDRLSSRGAQKDVGDLEENTLPRFYEKEIRNEVIRESGEKELRKKDSLRKASLGDESKTPKKLNFDVEDGNDKYGEEPSIDTDNITSDTSIAEKKPAKGKKKGKKKKGKLAKAVADTDTSEEEEATDAYTSSEAADSDVIESADTVSTEKVPNKKGNKKNKGGKAAKKKKGKLAKAVADTDTSEEEEATDAYTSSEAADSDVIESADTVSTEKVPNKKGNKKNKGGKAAKKKKGKLAKGAADTNTSESEAATADTNSEDADIRVEESTDTGSTENEPKKKGNKKKKGKGAFKTNKKKGQTEKKASVVSDSSVPESVSSEIKDADTSQETTVSEINEGSDVGSVDNKSVKGGKKPKAPQKKKKTENKKKKSVAGGNEKSESNLLKNKDITDTESGTSEDPDKGSAKGSDDVKPAELSKKKGKPKKPEETKKKKKEAKEPSDSGSERKDSVAKTTKKDKKSKKGKGKNANAKVDSSGSKRWGNGSSYDKTQNCNESQKSREGLFNNRPRDLTLHRNLGANYFRKENLDSQNLRTMSSFGSGLLAKIKAHLSGDTKVKQNRGNPYLGKYKYSLLSTQSDDDKLSSDEDDTRQKNILLNVEGIGNKMSSSFFGLNNDHVRGDAGMNFPGSRELTCNKRKGHTVGNQQTSFLSGCREPRPHNAQIHGRGVKDSSSPLEAYDSKKRKTFTQPEGSELVFSEDTNLISFDSATRYHEQNEISREQIQSKRTKQAKRQRLGSNSFLRNTRTTQLSQPGEDLETYREPIRSRSTPYPFEVLIYKEETSLENDLLPTKLKSNNTYPTEGFKNFGSTISDAFSNCGKATGDMAYSKMSQDHPENKIRNTKSFEEKRDRLVKTESYLEEKIDCDMEVAQINSTSNATSSSTSNNFQQDGICCTINNGSWNKSLLRERQPLSQLSLKHRSFACKDARPHNLTKFDTGIKAKGISVPTPHDLSSTNPQHFHRSRHFTMTDRHNFENDTSESSSAKAIATNTGNLAIAKQVPSMFTSSSPVSPLSTNHTRSHRQRTLRVSPFSTSSSPSDTPNPNLVLSLSHSLDSPMGTSTPVFSLDRPNTQYTNTVTTSDSLFSGNPVIHNSWTTTSSRPSNLSSLDNSETLMSERRISFNLLPPASTTITEENSESSTTPEHHPPVDSLVSERTGYNESLNSRNNTTPGNDRPSEQPVVGKVRPLISPFN